MDLKVFFQKVRETESAITADPVVVVSLETSDGGKAGGRTEVSRALAAKLIVEGKARLAGEEERKGYEAEQKTIRQKAEEQALRGKVMFSLVPQNVVPAPAGKEPKKPAKE